MERHFKREAVGSYGETFVMYHTPLNNTRFSIDAYNALIASIYLHQCFYILKILAHSVDFNELYRNVTIHCPSFSLVRSDIIVSVIVFFLESRNYHELN